LSVLNAPKIPPGRENPRNQITGLELARVELGGGEEGESLFVLRELPIELVQKFGGGGDRKHVRQHARR